MITQTERYMHPQDVGAGRMMLTATWRDAAGVLYWRQAAGDIGVMLKDQNLRTRLLWTFTAAWLSFMAATVGIDVVEIDTDPTAAKSKIVDTKGEAYTSPGESGKDPKSH